MEKYPKIVQLKMNLFWKKIYKKNREILIFWRFFLYIYPSKVSAVKLWMRASLTFLMLLDWISKGKVKKGCKVAVGSPLELVTQDWIWPWKICPIGVRIWKIKKSQKCIKKNVRKIRESLFTCSLELPTRRVKRLRFLAPTSCHSAWSSWPWSRPCSWPIKLRNLKTFGFGHKLENLKSG